MSPLSPNFSNEIDFADITKQMKTASDQGRHILYEHEVYQLLDYTGAVLAPISQLISKSGHVNDEQLSHFKGDKVVINVVSPNIIHKTEAGGVKIIANQNDEIRASALAMLENVPVHFQQYLEDSGHDIPEDYRGLSGEQLQKAIADDIEGVLIVEFIASESKEFGSELLVGLRNTREFGITISAGLGGTDTELFAESFTKGLAIVSASTELNDGESFFKLFQSTLAYKRLSGQTRGHAPLIKDEVLISCFTALINLAKFYSPCNIESPFVIDELEVNPFSFTKSRMIPLDGLCRFSLPKTAKNPRPIEKIGKLLHPASIGIIGVSATKMNFGRIILSNLIDSGYDKSKMTIIRPNEEQIDGIKCTESLAALEKKLDLLIVAVGADSVFGLVDELIETDAVESVMLIPGGLGETKASRERAAEMNAKINAAHGKENGGPVFLGGNCLGVVSHPGGYDSWFIPKEKLPRPQKKQKRNSALISQSGAFMITRMSQNPWLDPAYMTALGNQNDISHGDMLNYFVDNPEVDTIGVYAEGFNDLDGLNFARAVRRAVSKGKQVVFYKAGRSSAGQDAAMGHTASIAGDATICETILQQAGAIITTRISEFTDVFYIASMMQDKQINGNRLGAISGAGFETVGMADSIQIEGFSLQMAQLEADTNEQLHDILASKRLDALMEVRNPFDINPGADDEAHMQCTEVFCNDPNVDAVVVGLDPLSPMMRTLETSRRPGFDIHSEESVAQQMPKLVAAQNKPIIGVMNGGDLYTPVIEKLKDNGVVIFRSCDRAVAALAKYIEGRLSADKLNS